MTPFCRSGWGGFHCTVTDLLLVIIVDRFCGEPLGAEGMKRDELIHDMKCFITYHLGLS